MEPTTATNNSDRHLLESQLGSRGSHNGDPIMITRKAAQLIIQRHNCHWSEYLEDEYSHEVPTEFDAGDLFAWLGY